MNEPREPDQQAPRRAAGLTEHLLRLQPTAGLASLARAEEDASPDAKRFALYHTALRPGRARSEPFEEPENPVAVDDA